MGASATGVAAGAAAAGLAPTAAFSPARREAGGGAEVGDAEGDGDARGGAGVAILEDGRLHLDGELGEALKGVAGLQLNDEEDNLVAWARAGRQRLRHAMHCGRVRRCKEDHIVVRPVECLGRDEPQRTATQARE